MAVLSGKHLVVGSVSLGLLLLGTMVFGFRYVGRRAFVRNAVLAETRNAVSDFGASIARCAADSGRLPESENGVPVGCTPPKPRSNGSVRFAWSVIDGERGSLEAFGDLDGDGREDMRFFAEVRCERDAPVTGPGATKPTAMKGCWLGPVREAPVDSPVGAATGAPPR